GLDVEDVEVLVDDLADAIDGAVQLRVLRLHVALRAADGLRRVVRAQAQVVGESGADRLVAAVHGGGVDVEVDDQIRFHRAPGDPHLLPGVGGPQLDAGAGF